MLVDGGDEWRGEYVQRLWRDGEGRGRGGSFGDSGDGEGAGFGGCRLRWVRMVLVDGGRRVWFVRLRHGWCLLVYY